MPYRNPDAKATTQFKEAITAAGPNAHAAANQVVQAIGTLPSLSPELGVSLVTMATASLDCLLDGFMVEGGDGPVFRDAALWVALDSLVDEYVALRELMIAEDR